MCGDSFHNQHFAGVACEADIAPGRLDEALPDGDISDEELCAELAQALEPEPVRKGGTPARCVRAGFGAAAAASSAKPSQELALAELGALAADASDAQLAAVARRLRGNAQREGKSSRSPRRSMA